MRIDWQGRFAYFLEISFHQKKTDKILRRRGSNDGDALCGLLCILDICKYAVRDNISITRRWWRDHTIGERR